MPRPNGEEYDYIVVRRNYRDPMHNSFDWDDFESTVHAYTRRGYIPCGGVSISVGGSNNCDYTVAQAMIKRRFMHES